MVSQNKIELWTYVRNRTLLGVSLKEIYEELKFVHGNVTVSLSTVCRWMKKFKSGNFSVENAPYSGRPNSAKTKMNVDSVKSMVTEDARYTVFDIAKSQGISSGTVHKILIKELNAQKISARWLPHLLTDEQKEKRVKLSKNLLKKFKNVTNENYEICLLVMKHGYIILSPKERSITACGSKNAVAVQLTFRQRSDIAPVGRLFHCDVTIKWPVKWLRSCDVTME